MYKSIFFRLGGIAVAVVVILFVLVASTKMPNQDENGFVREWFSDQPLDFILDKKLDEPLKSIVGISENKIYLIAQSPNAVLILDKDMQNKDTLIMNYQIPPEKMVPFSVRVDTPYIFWHFNNLQQVIYGKFPNSPLKNVEIDGGIFTKSLQISPSTLIVRAFDSTMSYQVFRKIDLISGKIVGESKVIDEAEDGVLGASSEGNMLWSKSNSSIVYINNYNNRVYCIDTNLKVRYKSNTIDTITSVQLDLAEEKQSDTTIKLSAARARVLVNKVGFVDERYFYVLSGLRSDNQGIVDYNRYVIADRYKLTNGQYVNSIRLPKLDYKGFTSAMITNDTLVTLYNKNLLMFRLPN